MLVCLDTNHLIGLLDRAQPCSIDDFGRALAAGGHKLVLTFTRVSELAAPVYHRDLRPRRVLRPRSAWSEIVRPRLASLDRLPLAFIHEVRIAPLELSEAVEAFRGDRAYQAISPFVGRFDATIPTDGAAPPTAMLVSFGVEDAVFSLMQSDAAEIFFLGSPATLRVGRTSSRRTEASPSLRL